jgi:hypothetical protein
MGQPVPAEGLVSSAAAFRAAYPGYTHAVVAISGGRIFTGPLEACEAYMLEAGGESLAWRIVPIAEAQPGGPPVVVRSGSILW